MSDEQEQQEQFGELLPKAGGDPIPLLKKQLMIGRRESCDVVLRFGNVSAHHCEMTLESGYWFVKDLNSRNGTRVNGYRITKRRIDPGDTLHVGKYQYEMSYSPADLGAVGPPPDGGELEDILSQSLMDSAGLNRKQRQTLDGRIGRNRPAAAQPDEAADDNDAETPSATETAEGSEEDAGDSSDSDIKLADPED
jgi:adenylate cyclase